jgi:hypothetical protein
LQRPLSDLVLATRVHFAVLLSVGSERCQANTPGNSLPSTSHLRQATRQTNRTRLTQIGRHRWMRGGGPLQRRDRVGTRARSVYRSDISVYECDVRDDLLLAYLAVSAVMVWPCCDCPPHGSPSAGRTTTRRVLINIHPAIWPLVPLQLVPTPCLDSRVLQTGVEVGVHF